MNLSLKPVSVVSTISVIFRSPTSRQFLLSSFPQLETDDDSGDMEHIKSNKRASVSSIDGAYKLQGPLTIEMLLLSSVHNCWSREKKEGRKCGNNQEQLSRCLLSR